MASSTKGTIFYYYDDSTATQILGMMTKPALPGLPNSIESTSQEELIQSFVDGVQQLGDVNFQFKYMAHDTASTNFELFLDAQEEGEDDGTKQKFGVKYPDGLCVEFEAIPFVQRDGTGVNALDTFTVSMQQVEGLVIDKAAPAAIAPAVPASP